MQKHIPICNYHNRAGEIFFPCSLRVRHILHKQNSLCAPVHIKEPAQVISLRRFYYAKESLQSHIFCLFCPLKPVRFYNFRKIMHIVI